MVSRKTQLAWMAAGGVLCLVTVVVSCKVGAGNRCSADDGKPPVVPVVPLPDDGVAPPVAEKKATPPSAETAPTPPAEVKAPLPPTEPKPTAVPLPPSEMKPAREFRPTQEVKPPSEVAPPSVPQFTAPQITVPSVPATPPMVEVSAPKPMQADPVVAPATPPVAYDPTEPPLAPKPGPVAVYRVRLGNELLRDIVGKTLGMERMGDVLRLNPTLTSEMGLAAGTVIRLPADACVPTEEVDTVTPLPGLKPVKFEQSKPKVVLPLTGTFPCNLDDQHTLLLPRAIRDQLGSADMVMVSPGTDQCLWLTTPTHLDRLAQRMEQSQAKEVDVHTFKRLYFAQTEKVALTGEGRVVISDRLVQFAGLHQEVVLVGIDDHFELWDVTRWKDFTQKKSAAARANIEAEQE